MANQLKYEDVQFKASKGLGKKVEEKALDRLNTSRIAWFLIKRHRFGLVTAYAVVITALYTMPFLTDVISVVL